MVPYLEYHTIAKAFAIAKFGGFGFDFALLLTVTLKQLESMLGRNPFQNEIVEIRASLHNLESHTIPPISDSIHHVPLHNL